MPRRAKSGPHKGLYITVIVFVMIAATGGLLFYDRVADPYRTVQSLDVRGYMENANSLRGNVYKVDATIMGSLDWSQEIGRLISVEVADTSELIPVLVPAEFNHINLQRGQRFFFQVEVGQRGILLAQDLTKA